MATHEKVKIYYINTTKKKVGNFESIFMNRNSNGDGTDKVEIAFERPKGNAAKDKIEYYFNEEEWIEDIKKL